MAITATSNGGFERQIAPAGNHIARCFSMIDLGTHLFDWQGQTKSSRKVRITWELPHERAVFKEGTEPQPFVISKNYTLSMSDKAVLRKDLESWRGKPFTEDECKAFDVSRLLGVPCMLNVVHKTTKAGKEFADIASISPLPKGFDCPAQENERVEFSLETPDFNLLATFPEWLQVEIKSSPEYKSFFEEATPQPDFVVFEEEQTDAPF